MLMCYVDESGDTGLFDANERNSQSRHCSTAMNVTDTNLVEFMFSAATAA